MDLQNIKALLPDGSYERIATEVGIAVGTVAQFFTGKARVGMATREAIKKAALGILNEQSAKIEEVIKEHETAAIAA